MSPVEKRLIAPARRRAVPRDGFSWIDRRFVRDGFLGGLTASEALLYFFLAAVADQDGLSFWGSKKIAATLKLQEAAVESARRGLERKDLLLFRAPLYQVLALPSAPMLASPSALTLNTSSPRSVPRRDGPVHAADILRDLGLSGPRAGCDPRCAPESRGS